jgi:hypothetical protein
MKIKTTKLGGAVLAISACFWSTGIFAQTSTTVTTTRGAFNEYVPGSQTMVVRTESAQSPIRYSVTKQTTVVDASGAPVAIDRISPGSQLAIDYSGSGDRMVANRIVVQRPAAVSTGAAVTTGAAVSGPAVTDHTETTTTTTRPLTHEEKHAIHEEKEARIKAEKKELHRQKEALEHAEHHIDDDDGD